MTAVSRAFPVLMALTGILAACPLVASASEAVPGDPRCEYGIALAMNGNLARAESVFVSLLTPGRAHARAFNNLGNLELLKGDAEVALAFYDRALGSDSLDAGIQLNRSVALMLLGREDEAQEVAADGVRRAGGLGAATDLRGLRAVDTTATGARGAERSFVSEGEVRALLAAAARAVPRDSTRRAAAPARGARQAQPVWRSGASRAAPAGETPSILYWKR